MNKAAALAGTALSLVGFYLLLAYGTNAAKVLATLGAESARILKTLQARA
jgi:hypothetical protein